MLQCYMIQYVQILFEKFFIFALPIPLSLTVNFDFA